MWPNLIEMWQQYCPAVTREVCAVELAHLGHSGAGAYSTRGALSAVSCKMQTTMTCTRNGELYDLGSQWHQEQYGAIVSREMAWQLLAQ